MAKIPNYGCWQHVLATATVHLPPNQGQSHGQDTQLWMLTACFDNSHGPSTQPRPESWLRYSTMDVDSMFWQQSWSIYPTKARVMAMEDTQLWLLTACFGNSHGPSTQPRPWVLAKILNYGCWQHVLATVNPTKAKVMAKILDYGCWQHVLATAMVHLPNQPRPESSRG